MSGSDLVAELRRHQAAALLRHAAESIVAARRLLEPEPGSPEPLSADAIAGAASLACLAEAVEGCAASRPSVDLLCGTAVPAQLVEQLNRWLPTVGPAGVRILLRLMAAPDQLVDVGDLALAAGIKSNSTRVIKVYICRLRNALAAKGIPTSAIQTGRQSYGLQAATFPALGEILEIVREAPRIHACL